MFNGFEPVFDKNSRVLILGSFPSVKSREVGFYYGNKQNRFWNMLRTLFKADFDDTKESKIEFLIKHKIALFDVVSQSDVLGSADSDLAKSNHVNSNISMLLPPNTKVEKIICNGKTSYQILTSSNKVNLPVVCLPSTSSANPRFDLQAWQKELSFLIDF